MHWLREPPVRLQLAFEPATRKAGAVEYRWLSKQSLGLGHAFFSLSKVLKIKRAGPSGPAHSLENKNGAALSDQPRSLRSAFRVAAGYYIRMMPSGLLEIKPHIRSCGGMSDQIFRLHMRIPPQHRPVTMTANKRNLLYAIARGKQA